MAYTKGLNGTEGGTRVSYDRSFSIPPEIIMQATRDTYIGTELGPSINCAATLIGGIVNDYRISFGKELVGYIIELSPEGEVLKTYQEFKPETDEEITASGGFEFPEELVLLTHKFPTFPELFKQFTAVPIEPDNLSSVFIPLGEIGKELAATLNLPQSSPDVKH